MAMFDNYENIDPNYTPCNREENLYFDIVDEIVVHGTCEHVFKLHFSYSELCNDLRVFYKQSISTNLIERKPNECIITENDGKTFIKVRLNATETSKFNPHRATVAQVKLFLKNGDIVYSEMNKIKVVDTLNSEAIDPEETE